MGEMIFKESHGTLDLDELVCLADVIHDERLTKKLFGHDKYKILESLEYMEVEAENIFRNLASHIYPISYIKGFNMIDIHSLSLDDVKFLRTKDRIQVWEEQIGLWWEEKDWNSLISFADKRIALVKFLEHYKEIPQDEIVDIFASLYTRQEVGFHLIKRDVLEYIYSHSNESTGHAERMKELKDVIGDVEEITVYRGSCDDIKDSYSWTLSYDVALFFANRFGKTGTVYEGTVRADKILDYLSSRSEEEVLINPLDVNVIG